MNSEYLKELGRANSYRESSNVFWKEDNEYLIVMSENDNKIFIDIRTGFKDDIMPTTIGEKVAGISKIENVENCIINKSSIVLSFKIDGLTWAEVDSLTNQLVEVLKNNDITGNHTCPICKSNMKDDINSYIKINNQFMKTHKSCYEKLVIDLGNGDDKKKGSYLSGTIGAIIFGALGTIPWIIVGIFGWMASILGMLIGVSASVGYNKFKGRQGKGKAFILLAVLILMVAGAGVVTGIYEEFMYAKSQGYEVIPLINVTRYVIDSIRIDYDYRNAFMLNTAMGIGFGLLGSWRIIKDSGKQSTASTVKVELVENI